MDLFSVLSSCDVVLNPIQNIEVFTSARPFSKNEEDH